MKYLLESPELETLREFLRGSTLVALDYDGTLAPIVAKPEDAWMRDSTRALLARVARRYPVVILTGRARRDALRFLSGVPVLEVIGSHGVETAGAVGTRVLRLVEGWRDQLIDRLKTLAGVRVEDKRYSLSVHYRQAPEPEVAQELIAEAADSLEGARIIGGKKVVNVLPEGAPDKGVALLAACVRLGCDQALYVGDDDTDELAFAVGRPGQIFGVRVGENPGSHAARYLRSQEEVDELLKALLASR